MKSPVLIVLLLCCLTVTSNAQKRKIDSVLSGKIDSMYTEDQFWRKEFLKVQHKEHSDYSEDTINEKWQIADSVNELKAKLITKRYGYPGYDLVGPASDNFWAIIQHCDDDIPFQEHVLALMKQQLSRKNVSKVKYAYLIDRILVNKNQKQIYGTQLSRNDKTGKFTPFPLKYPKLVNKLRKQLGLESMEMYLKSFY